MPGLMSVGNNKNDKYIYIYYNMNGAYPRIGYKYVDGKIGSITGGMSPTSVGDMENNPIHFHGIRIQSSGSDSWNFRLYAETDVRLATGSGWNEVKSGNLITTIWRDSSAQDCFISVE